MSDIGQLRYLFAGQLEDRDGRYVIEIPDDTVNEGGLEAEASARIGIYAVEGEGAGAASTTATEDAADEDGGVGDGTTATADDTADEDTSTEDGTTATADDTADEDAGVEIGTTATDDGAADEEGGSATETTAGDGETLGSPESLDEVDVRDPQEPPVDEGETRTVEITDVGEQGDGLARIDRGYIVFVPETEPGDEVEIRITDTKDNFAFGEVVE